MKIFSALPTLFFMVVILSFSSCSNTTTVEEAMEQNRKNIDDPARLSDAQFLVQIKSLNLFQLELLKLANSSGYASEMVNLGKDNIGPFTTLDNDLTDVAKREKFRLPTEMSEEHQSRLSELRTSRRQEIDHQIIAEIRQANDEALKILTSQATEASDPDVRAFSARKIGALRAHGQQIQKVEEGLLTTVKEE